MEQSAVFPSDARARRCSHSALCHFSWPERSKKTFTKASFRSCCLFSISLSNVDRTCLPHHDSRSGPAVARIAASGRQLGDHFQARTHQPQNEVRQVLPGTKSRRSARSWISSIFQRADCSHIARNWITLAPKLPVTTQTASKHNSLPHIRFRHPKHSQYLRQSQRHLTFEFPSSHVTADVIRCSS